MKREKALMTIFLIKPVMVIVALIILGGHFSNAYAQTIEKAVFPTELMIQKITEAMPNQPQFTPKVKRKILVFSLSHQFYHQCIPVGKKAFEIMGKKTNAFDVVICDDIAMFERENLSQFDAILLNNAYFEKFISIKDITRGYFNSFKDGERDKIDAYDKKLKHNFVEFIRSGKGLIVLHAAVASLSTWPDYGTMVGARFDGHPWKGQDVYFKIDRKNHPLTAAFNSIPFVLNDEIYQVKAPYSRKHLTVLVSIDSNKTTMNRKGINRKDKDFGISWIKTYGKGRVFYCALGHDPALFWNPMILQHYLDGIQYAIGDCRVSQ